MGTEARTGVTIRQSYGEVRAKHDHLTQTHTHTARLRVKNQRYRHNDWHCREAGGRV